MTQPRITRYGLVQRSAREGAKAVRRYALVPMTARSRLGVDRIGALERIAGLQPPRDRQGDG